MDKEYKMRDAVLGRTTQEKDLGVTFSADMKVSEQCGIAALNGNKILGLIRRTITYKEKQLIVPLYKAIVRPHLEYCIQVYCYKSADWDKLKDDIDKLNREYFDMDPNSQDIDINWTFFRKRLTTLINNNIPRRCTKAKTHLPWITRELIRMQRRRNKSHKKAKQTGLNSDWEKI